MWATLLLLLHLCLLWPHKDSKAPKQQQPRGQHKYSNSRVRQAGGEEDFSCPMYKQQQTVSGKLFTTTKEDLLLLLGVVAAVLQDSQIPWQLQEQQ